MGIRSFDRIPVAITVTINRCNRLEKGRLLNLSENGMFIRTDEMLSPSDSDIDVIIPLDEEKIQVPGRIVRAENISGLHQGIGVKIFNPPQRYLDFIDRLSVVL